jgi:uncharacterized protein YegL
MRLEEIVEFAENPPPRRPCVLLLDTSGSMGGRAIEALNHGLWQLRHDLLADEVVRSQLELAIVTFDSQVKVVQNFVMPDKFCPPMLRAKGLTLMGYGIHKALDMIHLCKLKYREKRIVYYRPWVLMMTDGQSHGDSQEIMDWAGQRIHEEEDQQQVAFFTVGVQGANLEKLRQIAVRPPISLELDDLNFWEMFGFMQLWSSLSPYKQLSPVISRSLSSNEQSADSCYSAATGEFSWNTYGGRAKQFTEQNSKSYEVSQRFT